MNLIRIFERLIALNTGCFKNAPCFSVWDFEEGPAKPLSDVGLDADRRVCI
jgi:hypothetical protein